MMLYLRVMVYDEGCVYCQTDYQILSNKDEITTTGVLPFVEISIPLRDGCCPIWGEGGGGLGNRAIPDRKHFFPQDVFPREARDKNSSMHTSSFQVPAMQTWRFMPNNKHHKNCECCPGTL